MTFLLSSFLALTPVQTYDQIFPNPEQFIQGISDTASSRIAEVSPLIITFSVAGLALRGLFK
jgi:hypothetical protein